MQSNITIITINYNQSEYTIKCVKSILLSNYKNFQIILIDNGSTNEIYWHLRKEINNIKDNRIHLKRIEKNIGYVRGINYGFEKGLEFKSDYFLIMNNDTIIDKNAISELVKTCKKYMNNAISTGKVYYYDAPKKFQNIGYSFTNKKLLTIKMIGLNEIDNGQYDEVKERDLLDDVFWLVPQNIYTLIGGYSPYFWFNAEQADFALRAKKAGFKLIYTPKAKLLHKGTVSLGGRDMNPKRIFYHIQSTLILRYLHLNPFYFAIFFFKISISVIVTNIKALILGLYGNHSFVNYAMAKRKGFIYFIKWVFKKNENDGRLPF